MLNLLTMDNNSKIFTLINLTGSLNRYNNLSWDIKLPETTSTTFTIQISNIYINKKGMNQII
jgi:hypothetical protein